MIWDEGKDKEIKWYEKYEDENGFKKRRRGQSENEEEVDKGKKLFEERKE